MRLGCASGNAPARDEAPGSNPGPGAIFLIFKLASIILPIIVSTPVYNRC